MSDPDIIKEMHDLSIIFKNHLAVKIKLSFESKIPVEEPLLVSKN